MIESEPIFKVYNSEEALRAETPVSGFPKKLIDEDVENRTKGKELQAVIEGAEAEIATAKEGLKALKATSQETSKKIESAIAVLNIENNKDLIQQKMEELYEKHLRHNRESLIESEDDRQYGEQNKDVLMLHELRDILPNELFNIELGGEKVVVSIVWEEGRGYDIKLTPAKDIVTI